MDNTPENEQINAYLDRLCVWLAFLPSEEREEAREEVRQHIEAIVDGEQGAMPADAIAAALDKMGDADTLGERLYQARIQQMQQQISHLMPPTVDSKIPVYKFLTMVCAVVAGLALGLPCFCPQYGTLSIMLTLGAVAGTVVGAVIGWFLSLSPETPGRLVVAVNTVMWPPLPKGTSPRAKRHYQRQEHILRQFGRGSFTGADLLLRTMIPAHITISIALVLMLQAGAFYAVRDFDLHALRTPLEMAAMFAAQDITTVVVHRWLKRRPTPQ